MNRLLRLVVGLVIWFGGSALAHGAQQIRDTGYPGWRNIVGVVGGLIFLLIFVFAD
jgi:hypothetical protein